MMPEGNDRRPIDRPLNILSCLFFLAVCLDAAAAGDLYTRVNRLRTGAANCAVGENLHPLKRRAPLERVARDLSQGGKLQQSLSEAGYRATRSRVLSVRGNGVDARAGGILAERGYCPLLQDAAMTEIGIYMDAGQIWIVLAAPFAPPVGAAAQEAGQRVLELVNQARATPRRCGNTAFKGARPVRWSDALAEASRLHAEEMARYNFFSHRGRDGSDPAQRVEREGYNYRSTGENIAAGQMQPEDAVAGWIKSPGHCANLMNPAFTEMGAAFAVDRRSDMGVYWTQAFGARR